MKRFVEFSRLDESFDSPYAISSREVAMGFTKLTRNVVYTAMTPDGRLDIDIDKSYEDKSQWSVDFSVRGNFSLLLNTPNVFRILSSVLLAIREFIKVHESVHDEKPEVFTLMSMKSINNDPRNKKDDDRRFKVYHRMVDRFAATEGYTFKVSQRKYGPDLLESTIELRRKG